MSWIAFFKGMGSILDIFGTSHDPITKKYSHPGTFEDDAEALRQDWEMIGQDMYQVIDQHKKEK